MSGVAKVPGSLQRIPLANGYSAVIEGIEPPAFLPIRLWAGELRDSNDQPVLQQIPGATSGVGPGSHYPIELAPGTPEGRDELLTRLHYKAMIAEGT